MVEHTGEMKALTWKEVFASMNPSPVFEALAMLAEGLAIKSETPCSMKYNNFPAARASGSAGKLEGCAPAPHPLRERANSNNSSHRAVASPRFSSSGI